ncbi:MAG: serine/threonine protein kinase [Planctomycetes bacterium]|nr:serine/threonine protein kinase [Planctomycetota bacterium]
MSVEIWPRVRELFERALELAPGERDAFVARESAREPLVQRELRRLLANWSDDSNFLAPPGATRLGDQLGALAGAPLNGKLGAYTLERLLGSGGMGSVYLARQERPARHVALKLMRAGLGAAQAERHFEAEAEILARLTHPSIAAIYESGVHAGAPFFAMEYVEGALDLASFADQRELDLRARIELFLPVCEAVQHAHGKGVIHRDLKPGNVLVGAAGAPKVIDFGVARIVAPELAHSVGTLGGQALGTLAYAAPEQLQGDWRDVDVRADVYSLGATLFELLAGAPPFDVSSLPPLEALRTVCERPAPTPSSVRASVPRELDWVLQRCLAKERERRYTTVDELRRDLERWLAGEPLVAAPPSTLYRARKFVARNRVAVAAAAIVFASLVTALGISVSKTREADEQRRIALEASKASERDAEAARDAALEAEQQRRIATQASEQAARDAEAARLEARRRQAVIDSLASMLGAVSPEEDGRNVTLFELLERRRSNLESEFADEPRLRVQLQGFLIKAYGDLGLATHGLELAESSLATMEREGGYTPSEISAMQFFVARRYFERGRMEDGAQLVQRALDVLGSAAALPEDGVAALQMQAMALEKQGRVAESIEAFERALAAARTSLGDDHMMTIMLMSDTALGHASRRNLAVAEQLAREAHERANRVLPAGHSLLPLFSMRLGSVLSSVGKKAESLELQREVVARTEAIFGLHHRNVAQAHRELAAALLGARRYEEAAAAAQRALELKDKHHAGDAELETAIRGVLGGALDGLWRYEEAVENWRACVARFEELGRRTDPYAFQARLGVGGGLLYLRRFPESEASLRETLELAADALPPDDAMVGFGRLLIGQAIGQQPGRLPEGYEQVAAAYEILSKHDGPGPRRRAKEALEMLEGAAEGAGRPQDLERWRKLLGR